MCYLMSPMTTDPRGTCCLHPVFRQVEGRIPERLVNQSERQHCACVHVEGTRGCGGIILFLRRRH